MFVMRKEYIFFFLILFSTLYAGIGQAGEVDNYYAWEYEIRDSYQEFNTYLNEQIKAILDKINEDKDFLLSAGCEEVTLRVMDVLGTTWYLFYHSGALNTDMEIWAEENESIDRVPRFGDLLNDYYNQSIYAPNIYYFGIWPAGIDVTINVGGIYFGTDKISHFLGSGYEYFRIYLKQKSKNEGSKDQLDTKAHFEAIRWGVKQEGGILGMKTVKVFSYADLEANYQGLLMAINLCRGENANITFDGSKWILKKPVDFRDYVNPNWDETFNVSAYTENRLKKVVENIKKINLCNKLESPWVKNKLKDYRLLKENFEEKGFLDTSLSARLLVLSQRYQYEGLRRTEFKKYAINFPPGFDYNLLESFNKDLNLPSQKLHTLKYLCKE
jgi:hypothetical protein